MIRPPHPMPKLTWTPRENHFFPGSIGKINRIHAFTVEEDGIYGRKNIDGPWILHCRLTGIRQDLGHHKTQEAAMAVAEEALGRWLELLGVELKRKMK